MTNYYARKREADGQPQPLVDHLNGVADLAAEFCRPFGSEGWGRFCGLLHDLGKYSDEFQRRLNGGPRVDHSLAGAVEAWPLLENNGFHGLETLIGQIISGHHTGLANAITDEDGASFKTRYGTKGKIPPYSAWHGEKALAGIQAPSVDSLRILQRGACEDVDDIDGEGIAETEFKNAFAASFWGRMVYSALVDADFLDTERFMSMERSSLRGHSPTLEELYAAFRASMAKAKEKAPGSSINALRNEVYGAAIKKAGEKPGLFSLTVPTGGGKTFTSLGFALQHALAHGLRRVIYVIPFTSIIEQTAHVFREAFGEGLQEAVLEHHSNVILEREDRAEPKNADDDANMAKRFSLAIENWDAPIVVTTSVQFFESLFAAKSSKCRKLHNIPGSVIVLDECQSLPVEFLQPCQAALNELATAYGCSIVLCTATQPELGKTSWNHLGFEGVREIAPDPPRLFHVLNKRVRIEHLGTLEMEGLAEDLLGQKQALAIMDTKAQAADLTLRLKGAGRHVYHLSTNMCPIHRRHVLGLAKDDLRAGRDLMLVSTSLIEAGVDIDFPVVYRSLAGLDSVAQAAGRCNREGRLKQGVTYTFLLPGQFVGDRQRRREACQDVINQGLGLLLPEATTAYFTKLYSMSNLDQKLILTTKEGKNRLLTDPEEGFVIPYREWAKKFRFIDDEGRSVMVPADFLPFIDGKPLKKYRQALDQLEFGQPSRAMYRQLGQWSVAVREKVFVGMLKAGLVEPAGPQKSAVWYRLSPLAKYRALTGLQTEIPEAFEVDCCFA